MIQLEQAATRSSSRRPQSVALRPARCTAPRPRRRRRVDLADAGGGAGAWTVTVETPSMPARARVGRAGRGRRAGDACGRLSTSQAKAPEGERTGFVVLARGAERRRIPFWFRVTRPRLPEARAVTLARPGTYRGNAARAGRRASARTATRMLPSLGAGLPGPEQVFRIVLARPAANLGVAVIATAPGVTVEPRIVLGADENRLAGALGAPVRRETRTSRRSVAQSQRAVLLPGRAHRTRSSSTRRAQHAPAAFTFRLWIDDVTPPAVSLLSRTATGGRVPGAGARRRRRRRPGLDHIPPRRRLLALGRLGGRHRDAARRLRQAGDTPARATRVRPAGGEEQREPPAHTPEHTRRRGDDPRRKADEIAPASQSVRPATS